jgi:hypothetical protein
VSETPTPAHWPADQVERREVEALLPYARNSRTHSDEQVRQLAASIKKFGWTMPVLVDETGTIIAGHGRVLAARALGIQEVPVMVARGWSEQQRREYVIADNQLALNAGWDDELLKVELTELAAAGSQLTDLGFTTTALEDLLKPPASAASNVQRTTNFIVQYNIVFDDQAQQEIWFGFVRHLKAAYADQASLGAMLAKFVTEHGLAKS